MPPGKPQLAARAAMLAAVLGGMGCGASQKSPEPAAQNRVLALSINPRPIPSPATSDIIAAVDLAVSAGVRGTAVTYRWSDLEPSAGRLDVHDLASGVEYFGNGRKLTLLLGIQVLNTTAKETPADLQDVAFDSPTMTARFHALLDAVVPVLNSHVAYLSIGNEVDVYLSRTGEWDAYRRFYEDAASYARSRLPGVKVGVTAISGALAGPDGPRIQALNATSDVWILTYYPLAPDFHPTGPASVASAFPAMVAAAGTKPVVIQELGYPSAALLDSSEQEEADFFANAFTAWEAQGDRIPFVNVFALHDFDPAICPQIASYYGVFGHAEFEAYLCSLGLRRADGTQKAAWPVFVDGAARVGRSSGVNPSSLVVHAPPRGRVGRP